jgi:predicted regulator of amino acid metabolism with ACT domain
MIKQQKTLAQTFKGVKDETVNILHVINFNQEACRKTLGRIIIYDEFPFRIEKGLGFK